ncbi:triacylglycerol lipase [Gordonia araii NBRC 100433]|uniref:Triacylglycerol lipase n=1 Tax=Gordonia araii NBRC 100433 TaxID=1073574 RepID=G7GY76_9ACTN|nr:alpha/beta fold hydrolase [Gordonia araii]NNG98159.1 alpha/beta fold hydrolase [Gordonia araii NBRC 100433]GAB08551.1 triacylglycerol lipase [Gordonia araii NBRC 100433]
MRTVTISAAIAASVFASSLLAVDAAAAPFPVDTNVPGAIAGGYFAPAQTSPAGSNRWNCRKPDRDPVILLHGTAMNQAASFGYLAPVLANAGFCVFSLTYGQTSWSGPVGGLAKRELSARQVAPFVDHVLAATGASKVDLVGHSQGGAIAQLVSQARTSKVDSIIGIAASSRGFSRVGAIQDRLPARAPGQNYWGPRHSTIRYTNIATRFDAISTPYRVTLMPPGPNIDNTVVQDVCPASRVGHVGLAFSPTVGALVRNALDPAHRVRVPCGGPEFTQ